MPKFDTKLLENYISYCNQKNKTLANNISNIGTYNFQREDVRFKDLVEEEMKTKIQTSSKRHIKFDLLTSKGNDAFEVVTDRETEFFSGVNNVDIDREMSELAENSLRFKFASKRMKGYFDNIQNVIKVGGQH